MKKRSDIIQRMGWENNIDHFPPKTDWIDIALCVLMGFIFAGLVVLAIYR